MPPEPEYDTGQLAQHRPDKGQKSQCDGELCCNASQGQNQQQKRLAVAQADDGDRNDVDQNHHGAAGQHQPERDIETEAEGEHEQNGPPQKSDRKDQYQMRQPHTDSGAVPEVGQNGRQIRRLFPHAADQEPFHSLPDPFCQPGLHRRDYDIGAGGQVDPAGQQRKLFKSFLKNESGARCRR